MRKFYLLIPGILLTAIVVAQTPDQIQKDQRNPEDIRIQDFKDIINAKRADLSKSADFYKKMDSIYDKDLDNYGNLVLSDKCIFYYDENGNDTLNLWYAINQTSSLWEYSGKNELNYDENGYLLLLGMYNWNNSINDWEGELKYDIINNDVNGNIDSAVVYVWDDTSDDWTKMVSINTDFDVDGNLLAEILYEWDESGSQWIKAYKEVYTLDVNGDCITFTEYEWDVSGSEWLNDDKSEFFLDSYGNDTLEISYEWDESGSQWVYENKSKEEYTYDVYGNVLEHVYIMWNPDYSQWESMYKSEYVYDTIASTDKLYYSQFEFEPLYFKNGGVPVQSSNYGWESDQWNKDDADTYYYTIIDGPNVNIITDTLYPGDSEFDITITFSKQISGFEEIDITVTNGSVKTETLSTSDSIIFTATITPASSDEIVVVIPEYVAQDLDGNYNNDAYLTVNKASPSSIKVLSDIQFNIYPNPSNGVVFINIDEDFIGSKVEIINLSGSVVYEDFVRESNGYINLENLSKGIYIIRIIGNNTGINKKILLE